MELDILEVKRSSSCPVSGGDPIATKAASSRGMFKEPGKTTRRQQDGRGHESLHALLLAEEDVGSGAATRFVN
jgi:hypothetical protein